MNEKKTNQSHKAAWLTDYRSASWLIKQCLQEIKALGKIVQMQTD